MASTYSQLKIELMTTGENNTTWGDITNTNLGTALEEAITKTAVITFASADVTLTMTDTNATQPARRARLNLTGTTGGVARNLIVPTIQKAYMVTNACADTITVKNVSGVGVAVPAGASLWVYNNGTDVVSTTNYLVGLSLGTQLAVTSGGTGAVNAAGARANLSAAVLGANNDITSLSGLTTALSIVQGGTGATSAPNARTALGAAASGANTDITSLAGLTTALSVAQGGTGATTGAGALTNLGGTAVGTALFTAANAGAGRTTLSAAASGANSDITSLSGLTTPLSIAQGGTGLTSVGANGYVVTSDGTNFVMAPAPGSGSVLTFSGGTTGLTPSTASVGIITLGGTLNAANGGTGLTNPGTAGNLLTSDGAGGWTTSPAPAGGVTSFSGGTTGLTPSVAVGGAIVLGGTLAVANGGTNQTTIAGARGAIGIGVSSRKTANYTAVAGDYLACDTIAVGAFTVTLPATPAAGDKPIVIFDAGTTNTVNGFATNNLTVARNGSTVHTLSEDVIFSTKGVCVTFEYIAGTWRIRVG
jgi:hypothetical protein